MKKHANDIRRPAPTSLPSMAQSLSLHGRVHVVPVEVDDHVMIIDTYRYFDTKPIAILLTTAHGIFLIYSRIIFMDGSMAGVEPSAYEC